MALTGANAAIAKLQNVLTQVGLERVGLPMIAVVGSQSSGKSSVLEAIVGKEFLPRGTGIVTRRPLLLQLEQSNGDEFAEFGHRPGHRLPLGDAVRNEIEAETNRETERTGKLISDVPITLRVFSPTVLNLTLVDLPGLTTVALDGQQKDIVPLIRKMVFKFIEKESCLILAVSPANQDLANSAALQAAKLVDPRGQRTIGVVTKVDLMDPGTDAVNVLMGRVISLKFGIVGVVNRSQHDIQQGTPIEEALEKEAEFFKSTPAYAEIADKQGTAYLSGRLSLLLSKHVRAYIPTLRNEILSTIGFLRDQLDQFGGEEAVRSELGRNQGSILLTAVSNFADEFTAVLNGRHEPTAAELEDGRGLEVSGGARVNWIFHEMFQGTVSGVVAKLDEMDIRITMRNMSGIGGALDASQQVFESLIKGQIKRLENPCLETLELVKEELYDMSERAAKKTLDRFPELCHAVSEKVREMIDEAVVPLAAFVRNLIKRELAYINMQNVEFVNSPLVINATQPPKKVASTEEARKQEEKEERGWFSFGSSEEKKTASPSPRQRQQAGGPAQSPGPRDTGGKVTLGKMDANMGLGENASADERETAQVAMVQNLTRAYFRIVKKNLIDGTPKAIMYFLVNRMKANVQKQLLEELFNEYSFERLLGESEESVEIRTRAIESLELLKQALLVMDDVKRDVA